MKNDIDKALATLKSGGTILYPSDTIWGIGCDATNQRAAQKVFNIKGRGKESSFIILLDDPKKISNYVINIPDILWDLLDSIDFPTTIIYPEAKNLPKNVMAKDGSIAIRIVIAGFAHDLIKKFGKPIVSSSANFTGEPSPVLFKDISEEFVKKVDYVAETGRKVLQKMKPSTLLKLKPNGEFDILRP
jgi:L-threonylcarbamoyladenylate synthase